MAAPILTIASVVVCPHGAPAAATSSASRVLVGGAPVLTVGTAGTVQGCLAQPPAQACTSVIWHAGASRVFADGQPVLVQTSSGTCLSAAGQLTGSPLVVMAHSRVTAQ